ncbi:hypothetical protein KCTC32516_02083 [Polaribacter huanghezhanensis]|uniref:bacillithiol system redox-active protein YtxJ n=1 Tax=Polaribacter huanghezhanensis TaxID=1354726 RepID=UPI0026499A69|nr:bacillithiol system redox-active protein YtxJ [Polaribacter huanghezhanensis]WKD86707.1 hypothetical protein KCTC32516_02083 [Polaribacter huanghezhanensis]
MSLFKNIFKSTSDEDKKEQSNVNWIPLTSLDQLAEIKNQSKTETVLIFKHSTRCGISRMVIKQFEKKFATSGKKMPLYYLDLLNYRALSDEVGYAFQVLHQSPQMLVIKDGVLVGHASHYDILELDY